MARPKIVLLVALLLLAVPGYLLAAPKEPEPRSMTEELVLPASTPVDMSAVATIPPAAATHVAALQADALEPRFEGVRNGLLFGSPPSMTPVPRAARWPQCANAHIEYADEDAARRSGIYFDVTYLPSGTPLDSIVWVSACQGLGTSMQRLAGGVSVMRVAGPAHFTASYAEDRLESRTIAGKPAVIGRRPAPEVGGAVYMKDSWSSWQISSLANIPVEELIKVAEGIRADRR